MSLRYCSKKRNKEKSYNFEMKGILKIIYIKSNDNKIKTVILVNRTLIIICIWINNNKNNRGSKIVKYTWQNNSKFYAHTIHF